MKYQTFIDPRGEEEVVIRAKSRTPLVCELEALIDGYSRELIGYTKEGIVPIRTAEVVCFLVEGGKVFALTETDKLQLRQRLYTLEEVLDTTFVKINQSCIANTKKIKRFDASIGGALLVTFVGGHRDYVSRRQLKTVKERMGFRL